MSTDIILPGIIAFVLGFALYKKVDVFSVFCSGAREGISSTLKILPSLCFLMTAIGTVKASGAISVLTEFISPLFEHIGFPPEVFPLMILRPFSGSGALAYYEELLEAAPVDSFGERVASVLMGGSETTFYTLAVYYGAIGVKNTKNSLFAAIFADFAAAVLSVFTVRLFFG